MPLSRRDFLRAATGTALPLSFVRAQPKTDEVLKLPARAVTKGPKHHFFGYYDKTPWDKTGRYLLANEIDFVGRQPEAKDELTVGMVDLKDGEDIVRDVPRGHVFVRGDAPSSADSATWGPVPRAEIAGVMVRRLAGSPTPGA